MVDWPPATSVAPIMLGAPQPAPPWRGGQLYGTTR